MFVRLDDISRKESKENGDEGLQELVAHQTSSQQTINSKSSSNDEQPIKRALVGRTATIETVSMTSSKNEQTISGQIKRIVSLDSSTSKANAVKCNDSSSIDSWLLAPDKNIMSSENHEKNE